ncbi:serine/threonine-protein kinase [Actinoplanes regularis]|uniref:serine/threonine-protein kinase n=1 Tax=Actinoplanes regularis TaxID=52697 RepID=UPI003D7F5C00
MNSQADPPAPQSSETADVAGAVEVGTSNGMPDAPPPLAGRYRLGEHLGRGGMGQVWRADDDTLEREVAVKRIDLPEELAEGDAAVRRSLREARAAARLSHPNVVQVYDVLSLEDRTWIVMEYVPSRSLRQVIAEDGPLDAYRVARIGLDLLAALRAAHRAGVQHRDVKPANVLLAHDGRVLLTDFGIAALDDDILTSKSDALVGSPPYMAPERARFGTSGTPADLWGLGATLYAAVEGQSPFQRTSTMATLAALATEEPDPPRHAGPLRPVLDGLLRKDPAQRMEAEEAERLLRQTVAALDGSAARPVTVPKPRIPADDAIRPRFPGVPEARRTRLIALAAAVVALLGGLAAFVVNRSPAGSAADVTATTAPAATAGGSKPTSVSVPPSPASNPSRSTASKRPPLPAGWSVWTDDTGFSVYLPDGWRPQKKRGTMQYFRDGKGHVLGIDQTTKPKSNPVADWESQSKSRVRGGDFPGYRRIKIESVDYFKKAADWEFTFNGGGTRQHVNNRGVVTSAHHAYGLWFQTPDSDWERYRKDVLETVFLSFVPAKD